MRDFYNTNRDFHDYVERFRRDDNLTVEEALQRSTVRDVAGYYREKEAEERNIVLVEKKE